MGEDTEMVGAIIKSNERIIKLRKVGRDALLDKKGRVGSMDTDSEHKDAATRMRDRGHINVTKLFRDVGMYLEHGDGRHKGLGPPAMKLACSTPRGFITCIPIGEAGKVVGKGWGEQLGDGPPKPAILCFIAFDEVLPVLAHKRKIA